MNAQNEYLKWSIHGLIKAFTDNNNHRPNIDFELCDRRVDGRVADTETYLYLKNSTAVCNSNIH